MYRRLADGYTRQKVIVELPVTPRGNYDFTVCATTLSPIFPHPANPSPPPMDHVQRRTFHVHHQTQMHLCGQGVHVRVTWTLLNISLTLRSRCSSQHLTLEGRVPVVPFES